MVLAVPCIRRRAVTSFWAVLLLVFAASPLTAPFSSCSPSDFLNERELHSAALLQAKNVKDDSTAPMGGAPILLFSNLEADASVVRTPLAAQRHCPLQIPLRL